jgi:hypothetical protein
MYLIITPTLWGWLGSQSLLRSSGWYFACDPNLVSELALMLWELSHCLLVSTPFLELLSHPLEQKTLMGLGPIPVWLTALFQGLPELDYGRGLNSYRTSSWCQPVLKGQLAIFPPPFLSAEWKLHHPPLFRTTILPTAFLPPPLHHPGCLSQGCQVAMPIRFPWLLGRGVHSHRQLPSTQREGRPLLLPGQSK